MLVLTNKRTATVFIILCAALMLFAVRAEAAGPSPSATPNGCLPATTTASEMNRIIYQEFPARGPAETAWLIVWSEFGFRGLWIEAAWFGTPGNLKNVLGPSGLSNIFVPYHAGIARPYDLNPYVDLREALPAYTGPCGTISGPPLQPTSLATTSTTQPRPVLIKEIRDRGMAWTSDGRGRRGEELVLWSVSDSGNYEYIIQYGFRDDGTITFRLGSTGYNSPPKPYESHMHNALWYVDVNLGTSDHNSVSLMKHLEPSPSPSTSANPVYQATDTMTPFNGGVEGFADWNAEEFTGLNIMDTLQNARGNNISYDLMPLRPGTARHDEQFTKHDFWVTRKPALGSELSYDSGLTSYLNGESIMNTDVVIWYLSSNHHMPRDEDTEMPSATQGTGVAQVMWSGFDLHPRNFFDSAPHFKCWFWATGFTAGWWPFDETTGATTIQDLQSMPNTGTPFPGPVGVNGPTPVAGAVAGALSFDGIDDYIEVPHAPWLNLAGDDFTADFWIKSSQTPFGVILDKRENIGNSYRGYHLFLYEGKPGLQLANGTSFANYISKISVADGYWHHVAVTVNRTGITKEIRWYIDGQHVDTSAAPLLGWLDNPSPLRFAVRSISLDGFFKGALGNFGLYKYALSPAEVQDIYRWGKCGY